MITKQYTNGVFGSVGGSVSSGGYTNLGITLAADEYPTKIEFYDGTYGGGYFTLSSKSAPDVLWITLCDTSGNNSHELSRWQLNEDNIPKYAKGMSWTLSDATDLTNKSLRISVTAQLSRSYFRNSTSVKVTTAFKTYTATLVKSVTGGTASFAKSTAASIQASGSEEILLTASPSTGYQFSQWKVVKGDQTAYRTGTSIAMPYGDTTITPEFTKISYAISKTSMENGSVTIASTAQLDDTVSYSASADPGYKLHNLVINRDDNNSTVLETSTAKGSFKMVASALTVYAVFEKADYAVTAIANPAAGGTTTIKNSDGTVISTAQYQDKVTFSQTANEGYRFDGWSGYTTVSSGEFTIDMPNQAVSYTANYTAHTLTWSNNPSLSVKQKDEILTFTLDGTVTDNLGNAYDILLYKGKSGDIGASTGVKFNKGVAAYTLTDAETEKDILFTARAVNTSGHILAVNGPQITLRPTALHRTVHYYDGTGFVECIPYVCTEINSGAATWTEVEPMTYTEDGWVQCSAT